MIRRIVMLVFAAMLATQAAWAAEQILHLKDGSVLRGRLVETRDGIVVFETSVGRITVPQDRVDRIEFVGSEEVPAPTPHPERTPWPMATPPPQQGPWDPPPPTPQPPAPPTPPPHGAVRVRPYGYDHRPTVYFFGKVGWHHYSGAGWEEFGDYRNDFDGAALEAGMRLRLQADAGLALELVGTGGFYDGSTCLPDVGGCTDLAFSNVYLDAGPRLELGIQPLAIYGQIGLGAYASSFTITAPNGASESDSRTTGSAHMLFGAGIDLTPGIRFFGEVKFVTANGKFPDASENLDMGGSLFLLGGSLGF